MFNRRFVQVYLVPGAVLQSIMVGGGYGTGREVVEFFTTYGGIGGLKAISVAWLSMVLVVSTTFEFARCFDAWDYRRFFMHLLGRGWPAFEILIVVLFLLVLAVLASAAGNILEEHFHLPYVVGLSVMLIAIGLLTFFGRELIKKVLTFWSLFLYAVFITFFVMVFQQTDTSVATAFAAADEQPGWLLSGLKYAMYNLSATPVILYAVRGIQTRGEALGSGVMAAVIAIIPAVLFHLAFLTEWPAIVEQDVPAYWVMAGLGSTVLMVLFTVMLFGTFVETGAGVLQGINERLDGYRLDQKLPPLSRSVHAGIAVVAILISAVLSLWGIVNLIAKGYGALAWGFLVVYIVPLMTVGMARIIRTRSVQSIPS